TGIGAGIRMRVATWTQARADLQRHPEWSIDHLLEDELDSVVVVVRLGVAIGGHERWRGVWNPILRVALQQDRVLVHGRELLKEQRGVGEVSVMMIPGQWNVVIDDAVRAWREREPSSWTGTDR